MKIRRWEGRKNGRKEEGREMEEWRQGKKEMVLAELRQEGESGKYD